MEYTFKEMLDHINRDMSRICAQQESLTRDIRQVNGGISAGCEARQRQATQKIEALQEMQKQILSYYEIAKENTRKELRSSYAAKAPDLPKLAAMISRIDLRQYNDPMAAQVIDLCGSYLAYLNEQIAQCQKQSQKNADAFRKSEDARLKQLKQRQSNMLDSNMAYFRTNKMAVALKRALDAFAAQTASDGSALAQFSPCKDRGRKIPLGYLHYPLQIPAELEAGFQNAFSAYATPKGVFYPVQFPMTCGCRIRIAYLPSQQGPVESGIQAILQSLLLNYPLKELRFTLFDTIHWNAQFLGPFTAIAQLGKKSGFFPPAENPSDIQKKAESMMQAYQGFQRTAGALSLPEYNAQSANKRKYPRRMILLVRDANAQDHSLQLQELRYLANNADQLGILFVECIRYSGELNQVKQLSLLSGTDNVRCITGTSDGFTYAKNSRAVPFQWLKGPVQLPTSFVKQVQALTIPAVIGTEYFKRYPMTVPARSSGTRRPIQIPFAVDDNDRPVACTFENEMFAAFLMGASGSGKSTLLHTMIAGLVMNYHPDELELWLLDLKMTEFKKYETDRPPHIKYLLLMNSVDLVCDFIDTLCQELDRRMRFFADNGLAKHSEVPLDVYMPAIFVIIDEFAEVSDLLDDTYKGRLAHLLRTGRACGFKFLFASQRYTDGAKGLTSQAKAQIQMRFAMKGERSEIIETLELPGSQITDALRQDIDTIGVYQTIFKRNQAGVQLPTFSRVRNMYLTDDQREAMIHQLNRALKPAAGAVPSSSHPECYREKYPVLLGDDKPIRFKQLSGEYDAFEARPGVGYEDYDPTEDILIYPGVPESFQRAKPIMLRRLSRQNMMVAGASADQEMSLWLSVLRSWQRRKLPMDQVEIWAHPQSSLYKRHRGKLPRSKDGTLLVQVLTTPKAIYESMDHLESRKRGGGAQAPKLVLIWGMEYWQEDFADYDEERKGRALHPAAAPPQSSPQNAGQITLDEVNMMLLTLSDDEFRQWLSDNHVDLDELNKQASTTSQPVASRGQGSTDPGMDRLRALLKDAPRRGCFFGVGITQVEDLRQLQIKSLIAHKFVYKMTMDQSDTVIDSIDAARLEENCFLCVSEKRSFRMKNHIHPKIPCCGYLLTQGKLTRY